MPVSNHAFKTDWGCKLQTVEHDIDGVKIKENWLIVHPNDLANNTDNQAKYCFMGEAETRESSIFFDFAVPKIVDGNHYLLASINGDAQQMFECKVQKKEGDKWVDDPEKLATFYKDWKETGCLTAFHVDGIWNLELLVQVAFSEKVMLKDTLKCLFSKKEVPTDLLLKTKINYEAGIKHLLTGKPPKEAKPEVFEKLKSLNSSVGLPSLVLKEVELENDFGDRSSCPLFKGSLPDSIEVMFSPKPAQKRQPKPTEGVSPDQRMDFLLSKFDDQKISDYVKKIMSSSENMIKHIILMQITGVAVDFPLALPQGGYDTSTKDPYIYESVPQSKNESEALVGVVSPEEVISPEVLKEEEFDWDQYLEKSTLNVKEKKKIGECLDECKKYTFVNLFLYKKGMEMDGSTHLLKSRDHEEVVNFVCTSIITLYKVLHSETLNKYLVQLPAYLLDKYKLGSIEMLSLSQLKDLQSALSDLDKRASIEEVSLSV